MFSTWSKEEAYKAEDTLQWYDFVLRHQTQDFHIRYYLMELKGDTCSSSLNKWEYLHTFLKSTDQK
jgi:hypothetical protein